MSEYATYEKGLKDGKNDIAEGWICHEELAEFTEDELAKQLVMNVGATPEYIRGYLEGIAIIN